MEKELFDIFVNYTTYQNPENIFNTTLLPINEIKDDCVFVLDTNALLVPYSTGTQSLAAIKKLYKNLKQQNRLIIPGQVAREFANNRPEKLKETFQQLNRRQNSTQNLGLGKYPLLEELVAYKDVIKLEKEINDKLEKYRKSINALIEQVKLWTWNDPVSIIYKELFTKETIVEIEFVKKDIQKQLGYRYLHKIPPGFKDDRKADDGVGDFLIWLTILEIAKQKKHVIFVSGDEKNDWFYISEKQALYPRFELIIEFQEISKGKTFHILKLSELLNLFGADKKAVEEIQVEEKYVVSSNRSILNSPGEVERAVFNWLTDKKGIRISLHSGQFPNFITINEDGSRDAIAIIKVRDIENIHLTANRIQVAFFRYIENNKKNSYNKLHIVIATDIDTEFESLMLQVERIKFSEDIIFSFGYINAEPKFIEKICMVR